MKTIQWLTSLARKNPLLFSLVLMMIAIAAMTSVIISLDSKVTECATERKQMEEYYRRQRNESEMYHREREARLEEQVRETLNAVIEEYKRQLEEQRNIANKVTTTIKRNKKLISHNNTRIKNLE